MLAQPSLEKEPEGIGGWLVLPLAFLILASIGQTRSFLEGLIHFLRHPDALRTEWLTYYMCHASLSLVLGVGGGVLVVLFLRRHPRVPALVIAYLLVLLLSAVAEDLYMSRVNQQRKEHGERLLITNAHQRVGGALVFSVVWISYFLSSRRVQNTFKMVSPVSRRPDA